MHPFLVLGLPLDAEVPAIKRAYALKLRKHRPDEDPEGFQRVHEAYLACLELVRRRPPVPAPTQPPREPASSEASAGLPQVEAEGPALADPSMAVTPAMEEPGAPADPVRLAPTPESVLAPPHARRADSGDAPPEDPAIASPVVPPHGLTPRSSSAHADGGGRPLDPVATPGADPVPPLLPPGPRPSADPPRPLDPILQREPSKPDLPPRPPARPAARPASDRPVPAPVQIRFSLDDFLAEVFRRDAEGAAAMQGWLRGHEALYSLGLKQALTLPLLQALIQNSRTLSPDCLRVLLEFFGLDQVGPRQAQLEHAVQGLQARAMTNWKLAPWQDGLARKGQRARRNEPHPGLLDRFVARELLRPQNPLRRAFILLVPGLPRRLFQVMRLFRAIESSSPSPAIQREAVAWWIRVGDPGQLSAWRVLMLLWRSGLLTLACWWALASSEDDDYFFGTMAVLLPVFWILAPYLAAKQRARQARQPPAANKPAKGSTYGWNFNWRIVLVILYVVIQAIVQLTRSH